MRTQDDSPERLEMPQHPTCPQGHALLAHEEVPSSHAIWDDEGRLYCGQCVQNHHDAIKGIRKHHGEDEDTCDKGHELHAFNTAIRYDAHHKRARVHCLSCEHVRRGFKKAIDDPAAGGQTRQRPDGTMLQFPTNRAAVSGGGMPPQGLTDNLRQFPHSHLYGNPTPANPSPTPILTHPRFHRLAPMDNTELSPTLQKRITGSKIVQGKQGDYAGKPVGVANNVISWKDSKGNIHRTNIQPIFHTTGGAERGHQKRLKDAGRDLGTHTDVQALWPDMERHEGRDPYTQQPLADRNPLHIDHIFPLSAGGQNEDWNKALLGADSNSRAKNDNIPNEASLRRSGHAHLIPLAHVLNPTDEEFSATQSFGIPKYSPNGTLMPHIRNENAYAGYHELHTKGPNGKSVANAHYRIHGFNQYADHEFSENGTRHEALTRWLDAVEERHKLPEGFNRQTDPIFVKGDKLLHHDGHALHLNPILKNHLSQRLSETASPEMRETFQRHLSLLRSGPFPVTLRKAGPQQRGERPYVWLRRSNARVCKHSSS